MPYAEAKGSVLPDDPVVRQDILSEVQSLYGITEEQAITRLAAEVEAAELDRLIRQLDITSYAGSWFDHDTRQLDVAISDPADAALIERLGATPVMVARSLDDLRAVRERAEAQLRENSATRDVIRKTYIDYRSNQLVIGTAPGHVTAVESALADHGFSPETVQVIVTARPLFSAPVRGADAMCNDSFTLPPFNLPTCHDHPCSVGASIVGGYVTAGHCALTDNSIYTDPASGSGQVLGTVADSTLTHALGYYAFAHNEDGAWIDTSPGWTPQAEVNNYGPGNVDVSAEWSGMLEASVGATVCRYGQTTSPSMGADCGTVHAKDITIYAGQAEELNGMTQTLGICSEDGDSGGPFVTPSGQVQGTLSTSARCPDSSTDTAQFQPITTTLDRFQPDSQPLIMLTTHGANAPTINGLSCFELGPHFVCSINNYESQGETDILWASGSQSGTAWSFDGDCPRWAGGGPISVSLSVTNPYGTTQETAYVDCPAGLNY